MALFLAKHPIVEKFDLSAIHTFFVGAAPVGGDTLGEVLGRTNPKAVFRQGKYCAIKGTLPRKSTWALNVQLSEKTTMVPFIWM